MKQFSLRDFRQVLDYREPDGDLLPLIGGQSVNAWALSFEKTQPKLQSYAPFTSKDIDFLGDEAQVQRVNQYLQWNHIPGREDPHEPMTGMLWTVNDQDEHVIVEFLRNVIGISQEELKSKTTIISIQEEDKPEIQVKVPDPICLLKMKVGNAATLAQTGPEVREERQDLKHVSMLSVIVEPFLQNLLDNDLQAIAEIAVEELTEIVNSPQAKTLHDKYGIRLDLEDLIPKSLQKRFPEEPTIASPKGMIIGLSQLFGPELNGCIEKVKRAFPDWEVTTLDEEQSQKLCFKGFTRGDPNESTPENTERMKTKLANLLGPEIQILQKRLKDRFLTGASLW